MTDYNLPAVSILGCGWLGLPLAKLLLELGYPVKGSTTSEGKLPQLAAEKIQPCLLQIKYGEIQGDIAAFLDAEILIINIPPKLRGDNPENYTEKIQALLPFVTKSKIQKVIFISSTSVYPDQPKVFTEATKFSPDSEAGRQLLSSENYILNAGRFDSVVVRFGGLVGPGRHPVNQLSGKQALSRPKAVINLIQQEDCISMIRFLIKNFRPGEIFNGVAPSHPERQIYYTQKAVEFGLAVPAFDSSDLETGKIISGNKIELCGFKFSRPLP